MMKKFAFIMMGAAHDPETDRAQFEAGGVLTLIRTVRDFEEAKKLALELVNDGVGAIELCGAFGPEKAEELFHLTGEKIAIGYVTHNPAHAPLFEAFWGK